MSLVFLPSSHNYCPHGSMGLWAYYVPGSNIVCLCLRNAGVWICYESHSVKVEMAAERS